MFNFSLPNMSDVGSSGDGKKIKSYLFQLTEQLRYVLNNIDTENLSPDLQKQYEGAVSVSSAVAKLEDFTNSALNSVNNNIDVVRENIKENEQSLADIYQELYDAIAASADSITTEYTHEISVLDDSISSKLQADYTLKSETADLERRAFSNFEQTAQAMMAIFNEEYSGGIEGIGEFAEKFTTYIRMGIDGIELGKSDSVIVAKLSNNKLSFVQKGTGGEYEVAYISDKKLYITEANITKSLTFGSDAHGFLYVIEVDPIYGLTANLKQS